MTDDETTVRALFDAAGFAPDPEEMAAFAAAYPMIRDMVRSLYAVEAARYESPALVFDPEPAFVDWA